MMLTFDQIKSITCGAQEIREEDEYIRFYRFSALQREIYKNYNADFYRRCLSGSGIRFAFKTDSKTLLLRSETENAASGDFYAFDILVDRKKLDTPKGFSKGLVCTLPDGIKTVEVYFPWSAAVKLCELTLDDGAWIEPVKREKNILMYGDSITQGIAARHSYMCYTSQLADRLNAQEHNRGVGGGVFFPAIAKTDEPFSPDYITIAYGTNDWKYTSRETFVKNSDAFISAVSEKHPDAKIFAISPIWRKSYDSGCGFGEFHEVGDIIQSVCSRLSNVQYVSGFDLVPHEESYFTDQVLHPNDAGFDCYYRNLYSAIEPYL